MSNWVNTVKLIRMMTSVNFSGWNESAREDEAPDANVEARPKMRRI